IYNFSFANTSTEGYYNVTFIANDTAGNINSTEKTNFTVDSTGPTVTLVTPVANSNTSASIINISATVTDQWLNVDVVLANVTFPDNSTKEQLRLVKAGNIYNYSFGNTSQQGVYNITFIANDTAGNLNTTEKTNITFDSLAPAVASVKPVANNWTTVSSTLNISATVTDANGVSIVLANVTYPNNSTKEQLQLVKIGNIYNFSFANTSTEGYYNVTFIANDTAGNINSTEKTNFTVDSTGPSVRSVLPAANTVFDNASIENISATVTDQWLNVDVVLANITFPDNSTKQQLVLQKVGNIYNFSFNAIVQSGVYNITFIANDTAGNLNTTEKTNFTLNATIAAAIDIFNITNITFSPDPIRQNVQVSFNVTFNSTGTVNATGLNVTFTVDNLFIASTSFNLIAGTPRVVELNWTAQNGTHNMRINADANNTFVENFETNNNATATVTVYNVSVLNLSSPVNNSEIIRGNDTNALPGEDTLKVVSNFTTILARVSNRYASNVGVASNCTFYFNNTFLGWNQTNSTGECSFTFDKTVYDTGRYNITVNYTNLNLTNYLADTNTTLIQNTTIIDLGKVLINLNPDNLRTGSLYNPGDVAVMNISITKNGTNFDPAQFIVEVKNPGSQCGTTGGLLFNHTFPGDIVKLSIGSYQSFSVLEADTDIHWCVIVNDSTAAPLASASHSDKEVANVGANRANFTVINSSSSGDDAVFDDINITLFGRGNYRIFDRNFTVNDVGENRLVTLNEKYDLLIKDPVRQEQLNITGLNITATNNSLPFNLLTAYNGTLPTRFTNVTDILAFNSSGFTFTSANITLQKANLTVTKIVHCTNWNFSAGNCIGTWEINQTSDYTNFGQNSTHLWFQVSGFTAYAGGNGSNSNLTIYNQADAQGGSLSAEAGALINFTSNFTRSADNTAITGASCNATFSVAPVGPSIMTFDSTKNIYNFTRNFTTAGNFTWNITCSASSFDTQNASDIIAVVDTTAPAVSSIDPIIAATGVGVNFTANISDVVGVSSCAFFVNGTNNGTMTLSGTVANYSLALTASSQRIVELAANCTDAAGNRRTTATNVTITVPTTPGKNDKEEATTGSITGAVGGGGGGGGPEKTTPATEEEAPSGEISGETGAAEQPSEEEQASSSETPTAGTVAEELFGQQEQQPSGEAITETPAAALLLFAKRTLLAPVNLFLLGLLIPLLFVMTARKTYVDEKGVAVLIQHKKIPLFKKVYVHENVYAKYKELKEGERLKPLHLKEKEKAFARSLSDAYHLAPELAALLASAQGNLFSSVLTEEAIPKEVRKKLSRVHLRMPIRDKKLENLLEYVETQQEQGFSVLEMRNVLLHAGWSSSIVNKILHAEQIIGETIFAAEQQGKSSSHIKQELLAQ
ncbi:hypothetical protein HZA99_04235, partial [Candidatus Woesearchaeota archaeon]|nr:hypothetical protein [Candidatus Woesearchaeota archaeon]